MGAFEDFETAVEGTRLLEQAIDPIEASYDQRIKDERSKPAFDAAYVDGLSRDKSGIRRAVIESCLVRLVTAWEGFLADRFREALRDAAPLLLKNAFEIGGAPTANEDTAAALVRLHQRPFQDVNRANDVYKQYFGFNNLNAVIGDDASYERLVEAIRIRNAIVHNGGRPTGEYRRVFGEVSPFELLQQAHPRVRGSVRALDVFRAAVHRCAEGLESAVSVAAPAPSTASASAAPPPAAPPASPPAAP